MKITSRAQLALPAIFCIPLIGLAQDVPNEERVTLRHDKGNLVVDIASGRPLGGTAEALMREYGYAISYEDPRFENRDDLVDISAEVRRDGKSGSQDARYAIWVPKTRKAVIVIPEPKSQADIRGALAKVGTALGDGGGHFEIEEAPGYLSVVPRGIRDKNGNWSDPGSILNTLISLSKESRYDEELVLAICGAISSAADVKVSLGMGFVGGLTGTNGPAMYTLQADNERAGDVLVKALRLIGGGQMRQMWYLYYGSVAGEYFYAMNFYPIPARADATTQRKLSSGSKFSENHDSD